MMRRAVVLVSAMAVVALCAAAYRHAAARLLLEPLVALCG